MTIYYIAYFLLIITAFICQHLVSPKRRNKMFCLISFAVWALVLGLRHPSMGVDLQYGSPYGYLGMYRYIGQQKWSSIFHNSFLNYERGYVVFNKLLNYINADSQCLLVACSLISISVIMWLIYKYSKSPLLSCIVYLGLPCFLMNFSGLRQTLAIAITIISFKFIKAKKPILFILAVLLASTFHSSAIVFLIAYPCFYIKTQRTILKILSILLLPIVFLLRAQLFAALTKIFKPDATPDNNSAITLLTVFSAVYIFALIFEHKGNTNEIGCRNLFYVACICQAFGGVYSIAIRIGYYFMIYLVLLLPEVIQPASSSNNEKANNTSDIYKNTRDGNKQYLILYSVVFLCFAIFGLYSLSKGSWAMSNSYHFFWSII